MYYGKVSNLAAGVLCLAATAGGCSGRATADSAAPAGVPVFRGCGRVAVVEDGEDNDHQVRKSEDRNGYLHTYADDKGTEIVPVAGAKGGTFAMSEGGANGSMYAARASGKIGSGDVVYGGIGLNFVDPKGPYDASRYEGVSFFARSAAGPASLRLKVPDASTDPDGGVCSECFNDFGETVQVDEHWRQYIVPFATMAQLPGWGAPRPANVDPSKIYGLQWQVDAAGSEFDFYVDDITFFGCDS